MISKEEFINLRKQGKSVSDIIEEDKGTTTPEASLLSKEPSALSRIGGVAGRAMEAPVSALVALPAQTIRNVVDLFKTGDLASFKSAEDELKNRMINIPKEVMQGWTEGFWKQSDILSPSEGLGIKKESPAGLATNIAADVLLPGGAIKTGFKAGGIMGKAIPAVKKAAEYVGGVAKPALRQIPKLDEFMMGANKASQKIQTSINDLIKVDFGQTSQEMLKEATMLGKTIAGKTVQEMETLADKARKYGVPTDSWENAKKYIEAARVNAGRMVEEVSQKAQQMDWRPVVDELKGFVEDVKNIKGSKASKEIENIVNNISIQLSKGGSDVGYGLRNSLERLAQAKQRLLDTGEKVMTTEDQVIDMAIKGIRSKLNEIEPLKKAQEVYKDLSELSQKAAERTANLFANKEKLEQRLAQTIKFEQEAMQQSFQKSMKVWEENTRIAMENYRNKLNTFSPQKLIGKVIEKIPGVIGGIPGAINRILQTSKKPSENK